MARGQLKLHTEEGRVESEIFGCRANLGKVTELLEGKFPNKGWADE